MYKNHKLSPEEIQRQRLERIERGYPHHQPPHPIHDNNLYLITAACYQHRNHLANPGRRDQLWSELMTECNKCNISIMAWTILINHYHLIVQVEDFKNVGRALRKVHGRTSFDWNGVENRRGRKIWYQYSDRALRSERHFWTSVNYVHYNAVKHGLVVSPYDWQHCSVHMFHERFGREWLQDLWRKYPVKDFGLKWDL